MTSLFSYLINKNIISLIKDQYINLQKYKYFEIENLYNTIDIKYMVNNFKKIINLGRYNEKYDLLFIITKSNIFVCFALYNTTIQAPDNLNNISISLLKPACDFNYIIGTRMLNSYDISGIRTSGREAINIILHLCKLINIKNIFINDHAFIPDNIERISLLRLIVGKKGYYESLGAKYIDLVKKNLAMEYIRNIPKDDKIICSNYSYSNIHNSNCIEVNKIIIFHMKELQKKNLLSSLERMYFII